MTPDEHQMERMRHWVRWTDETSVYRANARLAEFDKRFPPPTVIPPAAKAPSAAASPEPQVQAPVEPVHWSMGYEIDSLRQKAQLWDAVASGKVRLSVAGRAYCTWALGNEMTSLCDTAEEAVEAAIAAGATK